MKLLGKIYLLIMFPVLVKAQPALTELDSLHQAVKFARNDTLRMHAYRHLGSYFDDLNPDSAVYYAEKAISVARQLQLKLDEAELSASLSFTESKMGNYPRSLKLLNMASEIVDNEDNIKHSFGVPNGQLPNDFRLGLKGWVNLGFAYLYHYSGNYRKAILYATEYKRISEILKDLEGLSYAYSEMGNAYLKLNMPDSALYFNKIGLDYGLAAVFKKYIGFTYIQIGETYEFMGDYGLAKQNFEKAIEVSVRYNKPILAGDAQLKLAQLFQSLNQFDSALYHSKGSLTVLLPAGKEKSTAIAYRTISDCYQRLGMTDSSFVYLRLATELNDKLEKAEKEKIQEFQAAGFEEALRAQELEKAKIETRNKTRTYGLLAGLAALSVIGLMLYRNNKKEKKAKEILEKTLHDLKTTQSQLIQSEKMASLGELTAGIAHEIQNPLNFVNNFSEINAELSEEILDAAAKGNLEEVKILATDIKSNQEKIREHGKRADSIVKGMLQHSRSSTGAKEPTNLAALADEYLRLAYHGMRAKDKSFNANLKTDFEAGIPLVSVVAQDIGRVLLNLFNNAFYAVHEKSKSSGPDYQPTVTVSISSPEGNPGLRPKARPPGDNPSSAIRHPQSIVIAIADNGPGIPEAIKDKIFQPFFTTKPTGQGTGLGLSLSYDIITKGHGGAFNMDTKEGVGSSFIISLPIQ